MILVELISKDDCRLCDLALDILLRIQQRTAFDLKVTKLKETDLQYPEFKEHIPVVLVNGTIACRHRIIEEEFLTVLQTAGPDGIDR